MNKEPKISVVWIRKLNNKEEYGMIMDERIYVAEPEDTKWREIDTGLLDEELGKV